MRNFAKEIALLSPEKRELLLQRLNKGRIAQPEVSVSREASGRFELSYAQQRLWFQQQIDPGNAAYNYPVSVRLKGRLDVRALEQSLSEIVRRHEALRTNFLERGGEPFQVISNPEAISLKIIDLSEIPERSRETHADSLAVEQAKQPFDLERDRLLRASLLRLAEQDHWLLLITHHIVFDGWSLGILLNETSSMYRAFSSEEPMRLSETGLQYRHFASWQRERMQGERLETLLAYWKKQLEGAPPTTTLVTDKARPAVQSFRGAIEVIEFPEPLMKLLRALSQREQVTLFMLLMAAFMTLLWRLTDQDDIVIGTDSANRNRVEDESLIGFFVNLLVMRVRLSGDSTFLELLRQVREQALGAYAHQELPFDKLVEHLRPERSPTRTPLVQMLFILQNTPKPKAELPGLKIKVREIQTNSSKFDLIVSITENSDGLFGLWNYNSDIFHASTIARMVSQYQVLLNSIARQPAAKLRELRLLTEGQERQQGMQQVQRKESTLNKLKSGARKVIDLSEMTVVKTGYLWPDAKMPLVIEPGTAAADVIEWAKDKTDFIEEKLLRHGALLFRGFNLRKIPEFERLALAVCGELYGEYGDLPRESVSGRIYKSTPYPADQAILFHNESSHMHRWPMKQWFFCAEAAERGGETPVVDCRRVYKHLDPAIVEKFALKGIRYIRNFTDGLDVSWQEFFKTTDPAVVESFCRNASARFQWKSGNGLRVEQVCPGLAAHPKTGEMVFFNQIQLHHISCLDRDVRESMLSMYGEEGVPRNVYYGDGSTIEDSVIESIKDVYSQLAVSFSWQNGDVLLLDNMLVAHGRNSYAGRRKVVVAMGEMVNKADLL